MYFYHLAAYSFEKGNRMRTIKDTAVISLKKEDPTCKEIPLPAAE